MSIKIKVKRRLKCRSDRVKSTQLHPTEPWMLTSLYDGTAYIWNTDTKKVLKSVAVSALPVRVATFVTRKNWIITGSDDAIIRVYNYNTLEKVTQFTAHRDYIRSLAVHTSRPFILSSADDGVIKLWDWEQKWANTQVFRGHTNLVMQVTFNPKDNNQFSSASLDKSVKIWQLGSASPNFSLPHERDVNCVSYHPGGDKPYIVSGCDVGLVKVWDYQTKSCVQTLQGHTKDVYAVVFHPTMPLIVSGGSDGTVRMWHSSTFKLVTTLTFGMERVWALAVHRGSNDVAIGFDEGSLLIKLGREEPAMSMDLSGKIVWAKHSELQQANIKALATQEVKDGEKLSLAVKDMGSCEIYPQTIAHSPNGRFVAVCGDGEYIIYTGVALRNKSYGSAQEFVWCSTDSSVYAVREGSTQVKVFRNFREHKSLKPEAGADGIYGGLLLGVRSPTCLTFHHWDTTELIRRIEITPTQVYWSESGELLSLVSEDSFHILNYRAEAVEEARTSGNTNTTEDGVEEAFEVMTEFNDKVCTGLWVGDCFIYTNSVNRLQYCVGEETVTISHLDRVMYLLGYIPKENRLYLGDKDLGVVSFSLLVSVLEYQTAVMRRDFDAAEKILPAVPREQRARVAQFLEKQGFQSQAMSVTPDLDHKFDLAMQLEDLGIAYTLCRRQGSPDKWKQLSDLALKKSEFGLAQECLYSSMEFGGLVLLASSAGNRELMAKVEQGAISANQTNVAFTANFVLGRCDKCLQILVDTERLPEAAFFARTYLPSQVPRIVSLWREKLSAVNARLGGALANPAETVNLFPEMHQSLKTEHYLSQREDIPIPARHYDCHLANVRLHPTDEMLNAEGAGTFTYRPGNRGSDGSEEEEEGGFLKVKSPQTAAESGRPASGDSHKDTLASHSIPPNSAQDSVSRNKEATKLKQTTPGVEVMAKELSANPSVCPSIDADPSIVTLPPPGETDKAFQGTAGQDQKTSLSLEEELARDLEGINLDDFDMDDFDIDSDELLED